MTFGMIASMPADVVHDVVKRKNESEVSTFWKIVHDGFCRSLVFFKKIFGGSFAVLQVILT